MSKTHKPAQPPADAAGTAAASPAEEERSAVLQGEGQPSAETGEEAAEKREGAETSEEAAEVREAAAEEGEPRSFAEKREGQGRRSRAAMDALVGEDNSARFTNVDQKKSKRKYIIFGVATLVIIILVVWLVVSLSRTLMENEGGLASFDEIFAAMFADWHDWMYFVIVIVLAGVYFLFDTSKYTLINRAYDNKLGFKNNAKVALTGKYYEAITPLSTGGQPMQIYYLHKKGISGATSTSVIFVKYGIQMLSWTVVAAFVMGFGVGIIAGIQEGGDWVRIGGWVGFAVNAFIPVLVTFVIVCPRAMSAFINVFVKLFYKMRIVKRPERIEGKIRQWVADFSLVSQFIYKKPGNFILLFFLCLTEPLIQLSMPYFVLMAMCGGDLASGALGHMTGWELYWMSVVITMYAQYAASYIPTPGASGAMETLFMFGFADLAANKIFWMVMVWRFFNYYVYVICGLGMNVFDIVRSFYRRRRAKKRALAAGGAAGGEAPIEQADGAEQAPPDGTAEQVPPEGAAAEQAPPDGAAEGQAPSSAGRSPEQEAPSSAERPPEQEAPSSAERPPEQEAASAAEKGGEEQAPPHEKE